nr:MAG TPA: hypothetical protein [Microviridae sp.]
MENQKSAPELGRAPPQKSCSIYLRKTTPP